MAAADLDVGANWHAAYSIVSGTQRIEYSLIYVFLNNQASDLNILYRCGQWICACMHHFPGRTAVQAAGAVFTFGGVFLDLLFFLLFWNIS